MTEMKKISRLENVQKIKEELLKQERLLTFFEEEENLELKIKELENKEKAETNRILKMHHIEQKLKTLKQKEEYVPPTISN